MRTVDFQTSNAYDGVQVPADVKRSLCINNVTKFKTIIEIPSNRYYHILITIKFLLAFARTSRKVDLHDHVFVDMRVCYILIAHIGTCSLPISHGIKYNTRY